MAAASDFRRVYCFAADAFSAAGLGASSSAAGAGEQSASVGGQMTLVPTYPRVLSARGAVAVPNWAEQLRLA